MLARAPRPSYRVDLVHEYSCGCVEPCHLEKDADQLLGLALPLGTYRGGGYIEESCFALGGHCLGQHGFTGTRGPVEEDTTLLAEKGGAEVLWALHRGDDVAAEVIDDIFKATDISKGDVDVDRVDNLLSNNL